MRVKTESDFSGPIRVWVWLPSLGMREKLRMTFVGRYGGGHAHLLFFIVWTDLALLRCVLICLGYTTFSILFSRESGTLPVAMSAFALLLKFGES